MSAQGVTQTGSEDGYRPSPRPVFNEPTRISRSEVTRHVWGDLDAGEVMDWIIVSSAHIHCLIFGLPPGGRFAHSNSHRTVFAAHEILFVLQGTLALANPESGEVVRACPGEAVTFGPDTWHHAFAQGGEELRVLELFAPPPSAGTSGAYARAQPYLPPQDWRYDGGVGETSTLTRVRVENATWRRDLGVLVGVLLDTDELTAGVMEVQPGERSQPHAYEGDLVVYVTDGALTLRSRTPEGRQTVLELEAGDAGYVPRGEHIDVSCYGGTVAQAFFGVAPGYLA